MGVYAGIMAAVTYTHYGCTPRPYSRPNNSEYDDGNNRENSNNIALHTWSEGKKTTVIITSFAVMALIILIRKIASLSTPNHIILELYITP